MSEEKRELVYIVTSGDYSDYSIRAVFSLKEEAEDYIKWREKVDGGWQTFNDVEEWKLGSPQERRDDGKMMHRVVFYEKNAGLSRDVNVHLFDDGYDASLYGENAEEESISFRKGQTETLSPLAKSDTITVLCYARDKEHAIKIASDKRAAFLAEKEEIT